MATLNSDIKKLKKIEYILIGAYIVCGAAMLLFVIGYAYARAVSNKTLQTVFLTLCPILVVVGSTLAAFLTYKWSSKTAKQIKMFILQVFVENAHLMHPDKKSLTFDISIDSTTATLGVNGYKEKIVFDFSPLGKLSIKEKNLVLENIQTRLIVAFCRLSDSHRTTYADIDYTLNNKKIQILTNSTPTPKAYRIYTKNKNTM